MYEELLSVIVPVYKVEKYLDRCIQSIVDQTYKNLEIILVDDGSPDRCPLICDRWGKKDDRISVIHKENGGLSSARNAGIKIARGKYITFVDSDDHIGSDMYKEMIKEIEDVKADIVCCGRYIDNKDQTCKCQHDEKQVLAPERALGNVLKKQYMDEAVWDKIYRKEIFEDTFFPEGEINEDIVVMPRLFDRCARIVYVNDRYYHYCQHDGGITRSRYDEKKRVMLQHMKMVREYIYTKHPSLMFEVSCFQARYALDIIMDIVSTENAVKVYRKDFKECLYILRRNYWNLIKCDHFLWDYKLKGFLIVIGLYRPARFILKNFKKKIVSG